MMISEICISDSGDEQEPIIIKTKYMNNVTLIGRLGQDAEQMKSAVRFTVATSDKVKGEDKTEWHNVVCVNANDKLCELLKKGCLVAVSGKVTYNKTEKGTFCNILCFNVKILVYADRREVDMSNVENVSTVEDGLPF